MWTSGVAKNHAKFLPRGMKETTRVAPVTIKEINICLQKTFHQYPLINCLLLKRALNPFLSSATKIYKAKLNQVAKIIPGTKNSKNPPKTRIVDRAEIHQ